MTWDAFLAGWGYIGWEYRLRAFNAELRGGRWTREWRELGVFGAD